MGRAADRDPFLDHRVDFGDDRACHVEGALGQRSICETSGDVGALRRRFCLVWGFAPLAFGQFPQDIFGQKMN